MKCFVLFTTEQQFVFRRDISWSRSKLKTDP